MKTRTNSCNHCRYNKFKGYPCVTCKIIEDDIRTNFEFANHTQKYWRDYKGNEIKLEELEDDHILNIVYMFGWSNLLDSGYQTIVDRFFDILKERGLETP